MIRWLDIIRQRGASVPAMIARDTARAAAILWLMCGLCAAMNAPDLTTYVCAGKTQYRVGDTVVVAVSCQIPEPYHLYANPLGPGIGRPLWLSVKGADAVRWFEARRTAAKRYQPDLGRWVWAYEKSAVFFLVGILGPADGREVSGKLCLEGLLCQASCTPVEKQLPFSVAVGQSREAFAFANDVQMREAFRASEPMPFKSREQQSAAAVRRAVSAEQIPAWDYEPVERASHGMIEMSAGQVGKRGLAAVLFLALLAGMILNVMPCVLPVLGVKVLSFSHGREGPGVHAVVRSLLFAAGMLTVFFALASLAVFAGFSWGQQFQNPWIVAGIVAAIFLFGLGMLDIYTIGVPSEVSSAEKKLSSRGLAGDFARGVFATVLATPCSGPFLGAVLAWTLTQKPLIVYTVFLSIGVGMAFPYVALSASKHARRFIPRSGRWTEDFKHAMGFLLLAFAVYLLSGQAKNIILGTMGLCLALGLGVGFFQRFAARGARPRRIVAGYVIALLIAGAGGYASYARFFNQAERATQWQRFSPALLQEAHAAGKHAVVNFTAQWCLNCQYNKAQVLNSAEIRKLLCDKNTVALEVDLTNENPVGESLLHHLGSRSVPFLAIFPGDDPYRPITMRDILNRADLKQTLGALARKQP